MNFARLPVLLAAVVRELVVSLYSTAHSSKYHIPLFSWRHNTDTHINHATHAHAYCIILILILHCVAYSKQHSPHLHIYLFVLIYIIYIYRELYASNSE